MYPYMKIKKGIITLITLIALLAATGCSSTRVENGVMIEKGRSDIPYVPFF